MKKTTLLAALFAGLLAGNATAEEGSMILLTPADLKWTATPALPPGAQVAVMEGKMNEAGPITVRLKLPANYRIPPHWHPVVERVTVLSGTFHYGMGDTFDKKSTQALTAGSFVVMPPEMRHYVWTKEATVVQLNVHGPWGITYVNPADDPRGPAKP
ncbi:MAG: cupin domain-containing protein [Pseudomonadota bacterium]